MEARQTISTLSILPTILEEIRELNRCDPFDISELFIEKLKSILDKIEFIDKKEDIPNSGRLFGTLTPCISAREPNKKDLTLTRKFIELFAQHKSCFSRALAIEMKNTMKEHFSGLDCFFDERFTAEGALKILEIKLENQKKEFELISLNREGFIQLAAKMAEQTGEREVAVILEELSSFPWPTFYLTPIFLRKKENEPLEIVILDASGGFNKECLKKLKLSGMSANVYVFSLARKNDGHSSSTFTVADIIHYSKLKGQGIDLFEYAKQSASPSQMLEDKKESKIQDQFFSWVGKFLPKEECSVKIFTFDDLPAMMMKMTQCEYPMKKGKEIVSVEKEETLEQNIEKYSYTSKKWNYHADFKFKKYVTLLVLNAMDNFEKSNS